MRNRKSKNCSNQDYNFLIIDKGVSMKYGVEMIIGNLELNKTVRTATTINDAEGQVDKNDIHIMIVCIYFDDKTELAAIEQFRKDHPQIKIIIMKDDDDKMLMKKMLDIGVMAFIYLYASQDMLK